MRHSGTPQTLPAGLAAEPAGNTGEKGMEQQPAGKNNSREINQLFVMETAAFQAMLLHKGGQMEGDQHPGSPQCPVLSTHHSYCSAEGPSEGRE